MRLQPQVSGDLKIIAAILERPVVETSGPHSGSRNGPGPGVAGLGGCRRAKIEAPQAGIGLGISPGVACCGLRGGG